MSFHAVFGLGSRQPNAGHCHVADGVSLIAMQKKRSLYHGHRFPAAVISQAVRWYFRFQLSLRDVEELLFDA